MKLINWVGIIFSLVLLGTVIELVRKKHLREKYSLMWIAISVAACLVALFGGYALAPISKFLGIEYGPAVYFLGGIGFLLLICLALSVIDSHQTNRIIDLTQKMAILESKIRKLEKK